MFNLLKILMKCMTPKVSYVMAIGDIPEGTWVAGNLTHAALASGGGSAVYGVGNVVQQIRAPQDMFVIGADYEPYGADEVALVTDSYRRYKIINGGTAGAGTDVLGSLNLSATLASNATRAFSMQTGGTSAQTVSEGEIIYANQVTIGGDHSVGTVNKAARVWVHWRPI